MNRIRTQLGELSCQLVDDLPQGAHPSLAVVLCHGFGAPGDDLVPLGGELLRVRPSLVPHVRFVFPAAPMELTGFGLFDARAWWLIDVERFLSAQQHGPEAVRRLRAEIPEGLAPARRMLQGAIDALAAAEGLSRSRLVIGGFSQGAMLAIDLALRAEEAPAALAVMSGTLACEPEWRKRAALRKGLRVFQSHGRHDPLLPFDGAVALRDLLVEAGLDVDFLPFDGEHTIPLEALERVAELIEAQLPAAA